MEETTAPEAKDDYELLDSGGGRVLERMGMLISARAMPQAWWRRKLGGGDWRKAVDLRREGGGLMKLKVGTLLFQVGGAAGHLRAVGPELSESWQRTSKMCADFAAKVRRPARVLHLFGGVGGHTLAAASAGASVAHVESVSDAVARARENAALNPMASRDIRWVVDDPVKFAERERAQNSRYDLIIIDPQTPRDAKRGFDLERGLGPLLGTVSGLVSDTAIGVMLVCRQGVVSPTTLLHLMRHELTIFGGSFEQGEILLRGAEGVQAVPCGSFCRWVK